MTVHLKPCHGCPVPRLTSDQRCLEKRAEMRAKVKGLGLTNAAFKCDVLADHFRVGRRISINTPVLKHGRWGDDDYRVEYVEVRATILAFDGRNFQCVVDLADMENALSQNDNEVDPAKDAKAFTYRKPMRAARIVRFLDEPDRTLCDGGNVSGDNGKCDQRACDRCYPIDYDWPCF